MVGVLRPAWPYLRCHRRGLALGVITILLMELVAVSLPLLIRGGVDAVTQGEPLRLVLQIASVMLVAAALKAVLQFFGRQAFIGISRDVEYDLRNDFFRHLLTLSPDFYRRTRVGELLAVIAGAPNYFRGGSHCGNLSCREAMAEGLVDILCSDFHFPSMLGSVVMMMREGMEPSAAVNMVTLNAARHLRRDTDLGSIEVGKKADLVAFSPRDRFAAVTRVWVDGTVRFQSDASGGVRQPAVGAA